MFDFSLPFTFFIHIPLFFCFMVRSIFSVKAAVATENICATELKLCCNLRDFSNLFPFLALEALFCSKRDLEVLAGMSHGRGGEENTAIYSIIFFPSQSPFIDFKDKGAGSALKMDEKLSVAEMDILPILPVNSSFHNFCFI